jgi:hypothetical protein
MAQRRLQGEKVALEEEKSSAREQLDAHTASSFTI